MTEYEYTTSVGMRYNDVDAMGHVNNALYVTYLEEARVDYFRDVIGGTVPDMVVAHLEIDYESAIRFGQELEVAMAITEVGSTSATMGYEIRADGERAATAETTIVLLDENRSPRPVPDEWRERVRAASD